MATTRRARSGRSTAFLAEVLPFAPIVFTWFAIGLAAKQSRDWSGDGTFLEGWRDGFGNALLTLEQVAFADAALIALAAFFVYRDVRREHDAKPVPRVPMAPAASPALIDGGDIRAAAETMAQAASSLTTVSGAVLDSTQKLGAAAQRLSDASGAMTTSTDELDRSVGGIGSLAGDVGALATTLSRLEAAVTETSQKALDNSAAATRSIRDLETLLAQVSAALHTFEGGTHRIAVAVTHLTGAEADLVETIERQRQAQVALGEHLVETVSAVRSHAAGGIGRE